MFVVNLNLDFDRNVQLDVPHHHSSNIPVEGKSLQNS